jgi:hypothetical protein
MQFKSSEFYYSKTESIKFDKGKFDNFCVYIITHANNKIDNKYAPKDNEYFKDLVNLKKIYGIEIYNLFIKIYDNTFKKLNFNVANSIINYCDKFFIADKILCKKTFLILYYSMVAEENKINTKLGKKIKRLGIHQILIEDINPNVAANFSKGMNWKKIETECKLRNF